MHPAPESPETGRAGPRGPVKPADQNPLRDPPGRQARAGLFLHDVLRFGLDAPGGSPARQPAPPACHARLLPADRSPTRRGGRSSDAAEFSCCLPGAGGRRGEDCGLSALLLTSAPRPVRPRRALACRAVWGGGALPTSQERARGRTPSGPAGPAPGCAGVATGLAREGRRDAWPGGRWSADAVGRVLFTQGQCSRWCCVDGTGRVVQVRLALFPSV